MAGQNGLKTGVFYRGARKQFEVGAGTGVPRHPRLEPALLIRLVSHSARSNGLLSLQALPGEKKTGRPQGH